MIPEFENELLYTSNNFHSEAFAKKYLTPQRTALIHECITSALQEYRTSYSGLRIKHSSRTEASIIHDLIINNIKEKFSDDPNTYVVTKRNLFILGINNGSVLIRFKKMDKHQRVHNIPTQQSFNFNNQLSFFGPSININAGYVPNGLEVEVFIACPENNKKNFWAWPIKPMVSGSIHEIHATTLSESDRRRPTPKRKESEEHAAKE